MNRYISLGSVFVVLGASVLVGCNSGTETTESSSAAATSENAQTITAPPTDVVSQFLDRVRRGGEDSGAGVYLTSRAQSELKRIGRSVQPIGSPDARYKVIQAQPVPEEPNSMLVQSIWTEPDPTGTTNDFEVVWAVQLEGKHWRISGLAMDIEPGQPPMVIDFENGDAMAKLLADSEEDQLGSTETPVQAAAQSNQRR